MTEQSNETTFDFGHGPVPAHQHINPDGSTGGWVANTAIVSAAVHVGPQALIRGGVFRGGEFRDSRDYLIVGPIGSDDRVATLCRLRSEPFHSVNLGCWYGHTLDELEADIAPGGDHGWSKDLVERNRADYTAFIAIARQRVAEWTLR
jgi:hypothetical protein